VAKSGIITSSRITLSFRNDVAEAQAEKFNHVLNGKAIQDIPRFKEMLRKADGTENIQEISAISTWLDAIFGNTIK
jgi:hypothetical protein